MRSLVLRVRGPLQAWGADSRYAHRRSHHAPTKSAIVGLLAAAQGRRRVDPIEDLAQLTFGVRVDQPGTLMRDFQTAIDWRTGPPGKLSERHYLQDACFLVALSGPDELLEGLEEALRRPVYPLFLGRRSCPANYDLIIGIVDGDVEEALRSQPWAAADWHRRSRAQLVSLPIYRDAEAGEQVEERLPDQPVDFDPANRRYTWRSVAQPEPVLMDNPMGRADGDLFWEAVVGA